VYVDCSQGCDACEGKRNREGHREEETVRLAQRGRCVEASLDSEAMLVKLSAAQKSSMFICLHWHCRLATTLASLVLSMLTMVLHYFCLKRNVLWLFYEAPVSISQLLLAIILCHLMCVPL
jgi:hypothetical protein